MQDAALVALDESVALAKRLRDPEALDQARVERREERDAAGLPADEDDRLAPPPRPIVSEQIAWSLAWFPPDQRASAVERWPGLADDFADPVAYARHMENRLATLQHATGRRPTLARSTSPSWRRGRRPKAWRPTAAWRAAGLLRDSPPQAAPRRGRPVATTRAGAGPDASTSAAAELR